MTSGWIRLFGVFGCVVAVGAFVLVFNAEATVAFLYWIEYLSAMPGLSGAFLFGKNWLISVSDQTIVDLLCNRANAVAEKQPIPGFLR